SGHQVLHPKWAVRSKLKQLPTAFPPVVIRAARQAAALFHRPCIRCQLRCHLAPSTTCARCRVGLLAAAAANAAARGILPCPRPRRQPLALRSAVLGAPVADRAQPSRWYATAAAKEAAGRNGPAKGPSHNFTETLCLPKTAFPLREVRSTTEAMRARCTDELYTWQVSGRAVRARLFPFSRAETVHIQRSNNSGPEFVLHDGPPFANGDLHIGMSPGGQRICPARVVVSERPASL
ncbi:MAG: hypothetical protein BJ554DRAFT_1133, partial [Olpidium bornovanus]